MSRRLVFSVAGVLAALLVAVIVLLSVMIAQNAKASEQASYESCMARHGFPADEPVPALTDRDDQDAYIDGMVAAAEACHR